MRYLAGVGEARVGGAGAKVWGRGLGWLGFA